MELLDIIFNSLKIFCITVLSTVAISYLIYKVKDRKRTKPYLRPSKNNDRAIKIEFLGSAPSPQRFEKLNSLEKIPVKVIPKAEKVILSGAAKSSAYIPDIDEQFIMKTVIKKNFDVLEHYSFSGADDLHNVKV